MTPRATDIIVMCVLFTGFVLYFVLHIGHIIILKPRALSLSLSSVQSPYDTSCSALKWLILLPHTLHLLDNFTFRPLFRITNFKSVIVAKICGFMRIANHRESKIVPYKIRVLGL